MEQTNDIIIITVKALDWTMGEFSDFDLLFPEGTYVRVDWDDGHVSHVRGRKDWVNVRHEYSQYHKKNETTFHVRIESESPGQITGFRNWSIDMQNISIDLSQCKMLETLTAEFMSHLDVSANIHLKKLDINGYYGQSIDLSSNIELETLYCHCADLTRLNLHKCESLKKVVCFCCQKLKLVSISNHSALERLEYDEWTPISEKSMGFIRTIIEINGGEIVRDRYGFE